MTFLEDYLQLQAELENPERSRTVSVRTRSGGRYSFAYTPLADLLAYLRPVLSKHGFALYWKVRPIVTNGEQRLSVCMILAHRSGEKLTSAITAPLPTPKTEGDDNKLNVQALGSLLTYMRRYLLGSLLPIASEEDDDGNLHDGNTIEDVEASNKVAELRKKMQQLQRSKKENRQ